MSTHDIFHVLFHLFCEAWKDVVFQAILSNLLWALNLDEEWAGGPREGNIFMSIMHHLLEPKGKNIF